MLDLVNAVFDVNTLTAMVVTVLVVSSGVIFREMTNSNVLTAFVVPIFALGALLGIYWLDQAGIYFSSDKQSNDVVRSGFGIVAALVFLLVLFRSWVLISDARRPPDAAGRLLDSDAGT